LLVAVSGGGDSLALLWAVSEGQRWPLVAVYVDHGLRPESGDEWAFVEAEARACGALFRGVRVEVGALAKARGAGVEEAARVARYEALSRMVQEEGAEGVLTGHSADDQAETLLWRLLRGGALGGLSGIDPALCLASGVRVWRPMLGARREEARRYLAGRGRRWLEDASNDSADFTRNRLRAEVMPALEREDPRVVAHLAGLAEEARGWGQIVAHAAEQEFARLGALHGPGEVSFALAGLAALGGALAREVIRCGLRRVGPLPSRGQLEALCALAHSAGKSRVMLQGGRWARREGARLWVRWGQSEGAQEEPACEADTGAG
jgi:tRNA(Ile)-lysidine synthase